MSAQFDTFDTLSDRRDLILLFQRLGEKSPDPCAFRAKWLERLTRGVHVNPASCHPVGAYMLFVQITGVLGVPIREAAVELERCVRET